jgi:hypothetical protein
MKRALAGSSRTGASKHERDGVANNDAPSGSNQDLHRELDKTLDDWNSGSALPKDKVAPPRTTRPPVAASRRPPSRTARAPSDIPAPSSDTSDSAPKKTAWDPTNPGF